MRPEVGKEYILRNGYEAVVIEEMPVAHMMGARFLGRYKDFSGDWIEMSWFMTGEPVRGSSDFDIVAEVNKPVTPTEEHLGRKFKFFVDERHPLGRIGFGVKVCQVVSPSSGFIKWSSQSSAIGWIEMEPETRHDRGRIWAFWPNDKIFLEPEDE